MLALEELLRRSAARHRHLCPRQVLGVRMGMYAAELLGLDLPQRNKRLFTFMETDGCALDGVSVATGCLVGRRTMRIMDFGKIAATFVDTHNDRAVRILPHPQARQAVSRYVGEAEDRWHAYLEAYQDMPVHELLEAQPVRLLISMEAIVSNEAARALCSRCGEEIFNQREVHMGEQVLCVPCAGGAYCSVLEDANLDSGRLSTIAHA